MAFNLQGAVQAAMTLPGIASQHVCAKFVRTYLEHGGIDTSGRPGLARQYVGYLPKIGYQLVTRLGTTDSQTMYTQNSAKPGDIAVYQKPGAPSEPGHICMWTGQQWVSDFRQNHMSVYHSRGNIDAFIYRYTGEISNFPIELDATMAGMVSGAQPGFDDLNTETLSAQCPEHIEFKGMWMRYQLQAGLHTQTMANFLGGATTEFNDDFLGDMGGKVVDPGETGLSSEMFNYISKMETGKPFGYTMEQKDLVGYDLGDAGGHKTFGYGLLYHPTTGKFMDQVKSMWTQEDLENLYKTSVQNTVNRIKSWAGATNLNQNQIDAIASACYNFGPGFLNKALAKKIAANPNDPSIFSDWAHLSDIQGKKYPGLIKRRNLEANWYFGKVQTT